MPPQEPIVDDDTKKDMVQAMLERTRSPVDRHASPAPKDAAAAARVAWLTKLQKKTASPRAGASARVRLIPSHPGQDDIAVLLTPALTPRP